MAERGYIIVMRDIQDSWVWDDANYLKWWLDISMMARYKEGSYAKGTQIVTIPIGAFHTSLVSLANRWGVSRKRVTTYISMLEKDGYIRTESDRFGTTIYLQQHHTEEEKQEPSTPPKPKKPKESNTDVIKEIIDYLNTVSGKNYKASSSKTITCINARLNEKFTIEDFKKVIDAKCREWKGNEKMEKYIRPETLFGTKFEGYLNESCSSNNVSDDGLGI